MRTVVILATVVAAVIGVLLWQLFASDPKPAKVKVPAQVAAPSPADAAPAPPRRPPPPQARVAEREPPEPGAPVRRPAPNFAEPPEPEPEEPDTLEDVDPERVSRCKRAIAHTFDLWARDSAQGDPDKFREQLVAGRPKALAKCARGEVSLAEMDCVLAAKTTADIESCGIGGDHSASSEDEAAAASMIEGQPMPPPPPAPANAPDEFPDPRL